MSSGIMKLKSATRGCHTSSKRMSWLYHRGKDRDQDREGCYTIQTHALGIGSYVRLDVTMDIWWN